MQVSPTAPSPEQQNVDKKEQEVFQNAKVAQIALAFFAGINLIVGGLLLVTANFPAVYYAIPCFISSALAIWAIYQTTSNGKPNS